MTTVNMHEAKTNLSKLVQALVSGSEEEIVIARNGDPQVRMTAVRKPKQPRRLGLAKGKFKFDLEEFNRHDELIADLFEGRGVE